MGIAISSRVRQRMQSVLQGGLLVSGGLMVARALGLLYGLVLARALQPEGYGFVQYNIALANVVALLTIPFGQHILAKNIAARLDDKPALQRNLSMLLWVQAGLFVATLLVSVPLLALADRLNAGLVVVYIGISAFYTYYGLARGFLSNGRLVAVFLGSNLLQIIVTVILYTLIGADDPLVALYIYGLSYFPLLIAAMIWWPLPFKLRWQMPTRADLLPLLRFAVPVWLGQVAYVLFTTLDVVILERVADAETVGIYALAKQLSMIFILNSMGISTVLMPRIARGGVDQPALVRSAYLNYALLSVVIFIPFVLLYNVGAEIVGGSSYITSPWVFVTVALSVVLQGAQSISDAILMGRGKSLESTLARASGLAAALVLVIPLSDAYGIVGVAAAFCLGALIGMMAFVFALSVSGRALGLTSTSSVTL